MSGALQVRVYVCIDDDCPPALSRVAHCAMLEAGRVRPLPATVYGPSEAECRSHLTEFLEAEQARERARLARANARKKK